VTATQEVVHDDAAPTYLRHDKSLVRRVLVRTDTAMVIALIAVIVWATVTVPFFAQPFTYSTMLLNIAPILLMVLPVTLIIVTG
jgi:rhamnose transport system permease protein